MAPGFRFAKQLSAILQFAVSGFDAPGTCCNRLTTVLSSDKVFISSDPGYVVENTKYWSSTSVLAPACIFVPESPFDVSAAVKVLVENGCVFGVRGGGHTANPGWAGTDSGVLISLSKLNTIEVSEDQETVIVGAGNRWGDVYAKTSEYGITVAGGRVSSVGVSGFLLGGGLSYLMHTEGFGANSVISYEIVLANGTVTTVATDSAGDLFKALKGGTGNFGIVTSFKLQTYPVNDVYAGSLHYSTAQYNSLFSIMQTYALQGIESDPKTHVISSFIRSASQGIDLATNYLFYSEPVTSPPPAIKPFFEVPSIHNTVKVKTVEDAAGELGVRIEEQRQDMWTYSIRANADLYKQLFEIWNSTTRSLDSIDGWFSSIVFQPISNSMIHASNMKGGNVLGLEGGLEPLVVVNYQFAWLSHEDDQKVYAMAESLISASKDIARSQNRLEQYIYLNYASTSQQAIQSYGPTQVDFLRKVKFKYDPNGVFEKLSRGGFKIPL
ncbi:hypothetical protein B0J17DRAFT_678315 [Rhizoctonia solani]|nr:hypothetical protein B0J17DRAFT_678315 [Rhizoctonia solani]